MVNEADRALFQRQVNVNLSINNANRQHFTKGDSVLSPDSRSWKRMVLREVIIKKKKHVCAYRLF